MARREAREHRVSVSDLKARCLGLVEDVRRKGHAIVITKRGEPVARLVPIGGPARGSARGLWAGLVEESGDIVHTDWSDEFSATRG